MKYLLSGIIPWLPRVAKSSSFPRPTCSRTTARVHSSLCFTWQRIPLATTSPITELSPSRETQDCTGDRDCEQSEWCWSERELCHGASTHCSHATVCVWSRAKESTCSYQGACVGVIVCMWGEEFMCMCLCLAVDTCMCMFVWSVACTWWNWCCVSSPVASASDGRTYWCTGGVDMSLTSWTTAVWTLLVFFRIYSIYPTYSPDQLKLFCL